MTGRRGAAPGERRGGRQKGTPNKATAARQAEIAKSGQTPLDYMLNIMRDPKQPKQRRDEMAKAAAPYVHPRIAAMQSNSALTYSMEDGLLALDALASRAERSPTSDGSA